MDSIDGALVPEKPVSWLPYTFVSNGDAREVQEDLDRNYERGLENLAGYLKTDPDRLRAHMDGRLLTGQEGMEIGLIDAVCPECDAYDHLLKLIQERNGK